jgi:Arc/MetJ family transcription regulator
MTQTFTQSLVYTTGMATNLQLDEELLEEVLVRSGKRTKREAVNDALAEYVQRRKQLEILEFFGTMEFESDWDYKKERQQR